MYTITTNAFPDQSAAAEMQATATNDLGKLIAAHEALMQPYEAAFALEDNDTLEDAIEAIAEAQEPFYSKLLVTRRALLDHRPRTLDEVRRKAEFMAKDRAFVWWDAEDLDIAEIIAALTPAHPEAETFDNAA